MAAIRMARKPITSKAALASREALTQEITAFY